MDWQVHALSGQLAHDESGALLHSQSLVTTARQQGKSVALVALIGWWLTDFAELRGEPQAVLSTAHKLDRAEAVFLKLQPILTEYFKGKPMRAHGGVRRKIVTKDGDLHFAAVNSRRPTCSHAGASQLWSGHSSRMLNARRRQLAAMWNDTARFNFAPGRADS